MEIVFYYTLYDIWLYYNITSNKGMPGETISPDKHRNEALFQHSRSEKCQVTMYTCLNVIGSYWWACCQNSWKERSCESEAWL